MRRAKAVAIISGGLDSTVLGYHLRSEGYPLEVLSFDYGQRHHKELRYAERVAAALTSPWHLIDLAAAGLPNFLTGSALTDRDVEVPDGHYASENMKVTIVPNRNAIMLSIACAVAGATHADAVALAVHSGDHPIYPDCRAEFVQAFQSMERLAMGMPELQIKAPFLEKTKGEIVRLGSELGIPFEETWSCYKGGELHCGRCGTCVERQEAFQQAGVVDPTKYL